MFETGDNVRILEGAAAWTIVGIYPNGVYEVQLGNDGGSKKIVKENSLQLLAKAKKVESESRFVIDRSIMDVGY